MFDQNKNSFSDRVFIYDVKQNNIYCYANDTLNISHSDINKFNEMIGFITSLKSPACINSEMCVQNRSGHFAIANVCFVTTAPDSNVIIAVDDIGSSCRITHERDQLTGLYHKASFIELIKNRLNYSDAFTGEKLTLIYFDVQRFKTINDMFGSEDGDRLLRHISDVIREHKGNKGIGCRIDSDRFVLAVPLSFDSIPQYVEKLLDDISEFDLPFEVACNAGIYIIGTEKVAPELIIDRAIMAQSPIKGSYIQRYNIYTESLRKQLLTVQEITGMMKAAIKTDQFVVFYQPQYDHSNGTIVGAEGLIRWIHPERGLISPGIFVPVFEKNGFITTLDLYVFEKVCEFLKKCIDRKLRIVPLSTNLTRYDIFSPGFIDKLEEIRKKYNVPSKYLRIEITESVALGNTEFINESVRKLHSFGYIVEMDDFGSGYSSLNILKDIDFDIIKLDMKFLKQSKETNFRGGTILSSVVRMVNLLGLPIIAEGVETLQQADFLRSIGCDYIQGYLYSKPLPENDYVDLIEKSNIGTNIPYRNKQEQSPVLCYDTQCNCRKKTV